MMGEAVVTGGECPGRPGPSVSSLPVGEVVMIKKPETRAFVSGSGDMLSGMIYGRYVEPPL